MCLLQNIRLTLNFKFRFTTTKNRYTMYIYKTTTVYALLNLILILHVMFIYGGTQTLTMWEGFQPIVIQDSGLHTYDSRPEFWLNFLWSIVLFSMHHPLAADCSQLYCPALDRLYIDEMYHWNVVWCNYKNIIDDNNNIDVHFFSVLSCRTNWFLLSHINHFVCLFALCSFYTCVYM